jgi:predicted permease
MWTEVAFDLRLALRRQQQRPGFTLAVIGLLALCIGANTAVFSLVSNAILRPLPVERPEELFSLDSVGRGRVSPVFSFPNYLDLRDRNTSLTALAAFRIVPVHLGADGRSDRLWGYLATGNYFSALRVKPYLGRLLTPSDDDSNAVVVLSHGTWTKRFGADPSVIGRKVTLNGQELQIVGIAPPDFVGTEKLVRCDLWAPMSLQPRIEPSHPALTQRDYERMFLFGRLKPALTVEQAQADLQRVAQQLGDEFPDSSQGLSIQLTPAGLLGGYLRGPSVRFSVALLVVTALLLLVACGNVSGLLLSRAADRTRETAISLALGASRSRLVQQHLMESLLLSVAGGAGGLLLAAWLNEALEALLPSLHLPVGFDLHLDLRIIAFCVGLTVATCLLCGLTPAGRATRLNVLAGLQNQGGSGWLRRWQLRDALVALQIAGALVPLTAALLAAQGLRQTLATGLGLQLDGASTLTVDFDLRGYAPARREAFGRRLLEEVGGVAGLISALPLGIDTAANSILVEGDSPQAAATLPLAAKYTTSPGYFAAAGTKLLSGRLFRDAEQAPVLLVNAAFARRFLPADRPFSRRVAFVPGGPWHEVVGIVETGKYRSVNEEPMPAIFLPWSAGSSGRLTVVARSEAPEAELQRHLREAVRRLDPTLAVFDEGPLRDRFRLALLPGRVAAGALSTFAALSLFMACSGIVGLMAYAVSQRSREIGIRMAIGATPWQAIDGLLRRVTLLITVGALGGLLLSATVSRFLGPLLAGGTELNLSALASAVTVLGVAAVLAALYPARRATRIDPLIALRYD